ncbi:hypothetical protein PR048_015000 [Dryococelus australis]|uniref:Uncharacterized protein n=1 Tax=Dryococelus australis TaxID=614101 RepID=A0ABQ9HFV4_9NEOP|nr:hypothetical protein PR048_015000 [Dryococelus australis]
MLYSTYNQLGSGSVAINYSPPNGELGSIPGRATKIFACGKRGGRVANLVRVERISGSSRCSLRNCRSPRKPADQQHRPARFPRAKIRERPRRESSTVRLGGRRKFSFEKVGNYAVACVAFDRRAFSKYSGAAPSSPHFTLVGSQELAVTCRAKHIKLKYILQRIDSHLRIRRDWRYFKSTAILGLELPGSTAARAFAFYKGKPDSIPDGIAPGFPQVGIVPDDAACRRIFSGISRFPHPSKFGAAPYSTLFTLIGCEDTEVKEPSKLLSGRLNSLISVVLLPYPVQTLSARPLYLSTPPGSLSTSPTCPESASRINLPIVKLVFSFAFFVMDDAEGLQSIWFAALAIPSRYSNATFHRHYTLV